MKVPRKKPLNSTSRAAPSVEEMKKALGLDKVRPIPMSPSDEEEFQAKGDPFKDWYEEELHELYEKKRPR